MPVLFSCPHCDHESLIDEALVGQSGPCAVCGKTILVNPAAVRQSEPQPQTRPGPSAGGIVAAIAILVALGGVVAAALVFALWDRTSPTPRPAPLPVARRPLPGNLVKIVRAIEAYHDRHGSYPPAAVTDSNGQKLHSWRVLILPFLGYQRLYDRYDLSEPWNSPANSTLLKLMPAEYAADNRALGMGKTNCVAVIGSSTVFRTAGKVRRQDVTDGRHNTALVVEDPSYSIDWLAPQDWDLGTLVIQSRLNGETVFVTADGARARRVPETTPITVLRGLFTIDGRETAEWKKYVEVEPGQATGMRRPTAKAKVLN